MTQLFYVGVDGGATKCIVRLEDEAGCLLGREVSGPASVRLSVDQAWHSIQLALNKLLQTHADTSSANPPRLHVGMGLAGCEVTAAYQEFIHRKHGFDALVVTSDAHVACLGAHNGRDGAIIIAGTGVVGYQLQAGKPTKVGGWGFPHDDDGGGAWLGLQAVKITVQTLDYRLPSSTLAKAVFARFDDKPDLLAAFANSATSTNFAELAPLVIELSQQGDALALDLIKQAAQAINRVGNALSSTLPCALVGSIATFLEPHLDSGLQARLRSCQSAPDAGAILLVRQQAKVLQ